jgi:hypothetical protein
VEQAGEDAMTKMTIEFGEILYVFAEDDEDWLHPFDDNTFKHQEEIVHEYWHQGERDGREEVHEYFCKRVAGGL